MSMSVAQAREVHRLVTEIVELLNEIDVQMDKDERKAKQIKYTFTDVYAVIQDVFYLLRQAGLGDEAAEIISRIHRIIIALNSLRVAIIALEAALAATGPAGWVVHGVAALAGGVAGFISIATATDSRRRF